MSKKFNTQKSTFEGKIQTVQRRAQRAMKYAQAERVNRSGRALKEVC